jgi:hypothetical protein
MLTDKAFRARLPRVTASLDLTQQMNRKALRDYVLTHREDDEALRVYMDRLRTEPDVKRSKGGLSEEDLARLEQVIKAASDRTSGKHS